MSSGVSGARAPAGTRGAHRKRRRRALRRWPRRLLITANLTIAIMLIGSGLVYGYVEYRLDNIKTGSSKGLAVGPEKADASQAADGLKAQNILLIGNETRAGQVDVNFGSASEFTGALSDVIMILHLDPKAGTASILSIPRDVFTPMPAGSLVGPYQKIDAALNDGKLGPNNLAAAITQDFGIPINHYVEVDFDGFLQTVNALGGIKMDFPERLYDAVSDLDISHTGCQLLHGQQALALVRSRHLQYDPPGVSPDDISAWPYDPESDLARIVRDHTFIRVLAQTAESEGLGDPFKLNAFLSAVLSQLTVDPALKNELIPLASRFHSLNPNAAPATTIPVTQVLGPDADGYSYGDAQIGDVEFPDEPADMDTIRKWDPGALPTPVMPSAVKVFNITDSPDLGQQTAAALGADGLHVTTYANGTVPASETETMVQYHPGQLAEGVAVFEKLSGAVILQSVASVPAGTVEVQAGSTLAVDKPSTASSSTTTTTSPTTGASASASSTTTTTTVPTPGGQAPSSATDQLTPYDPRPCT